MVTLNMESRNPTGRVYAENRSKTQKLLGVKGLNVQNMSYSLFSMQHGSWRLSESQTHVLHN